MRIEENEETHKNTSIDNPQPLHTLDRKIRVHNTARSIVPCRHGSGTGRVEDRGGVVACELGKFVVCGGVRGDYGVYSAKVGGTVCVRVKDRAFEKIGRNILTDDIIAEGGRGDVATGGFDGFNNSVNVEARVQETLAVFIEQSEPPKIVDVCNNRLTGSMSGKSKGSVEFRVTVPPVRREMLTKED